MDEYDNIIEAFKWANASHYLDKEKMCRQRGSDILQDATSWRPGNNRTVFGRGSSAQCPNGSHPLDTEFLTMALTASGGQAAGLLNLCVTNNTVANVTTALECTNPRKKLRTWTRPLEGY